MIDYGCIISLKSYWVICAQTKWLPPSIAASRGVRLDASCQVSRTDGSTYVRHSNPDGINQMECISLFSEHVPAQNVQSQDHVTWSCLSFCSKFASLLTKRRQFRYPCPVGQFKCDSGSDLMLVLEYLESFPEPWGFHSLWSLDISGMPLPHMRLSKQPTSLCSSEV